MEIGEWRLEIRDWRFAQSPISNYQSPVYRFVKAGRRADEAMGRFAGDGVGGELEGALGAAVGQVYADHHRHADGHADDEQDVLQRPSSQPPPGETEEGEGGDLGFGIWDFGLGHGVVIRNP